MKRVISFCLFVMAAAAVVAGQATPPKPQTPRQALLEMFFSKKPQAFDRHLPKRARQRMEGLGILDRTLRPVPFDELQMKSVTTFDEGPLLLTYEPPPSENPHTLGQRQRIEVTVEQDDLRGDEAFLELGFHRYVDGAEQMGQLEPHLSIKMVMETGVWKLGDVGFRGHLPLDSPEFLADFEKEVAPDRLASNEGNAVRGLRVINVAEISYQTTYGHYTCSLAALDGEGAGKPDADHAMLLDSALASGKQGGYVFRITDCGSGSAYRASAVPQKPGVSGVRAFCTDTSGTYRYSAEGSEQTCFANGKPVGE